MVTESMECFCELLYLKIYMKSTPEAFYAEQGVSFEILITRIWVCILIERLPSKSALFSTLMTLANCSLNLIVTT